MRVNVEELVENLQLDGLCLVREDTLDQIIKWAGLHPEAEDRLLDDPFATRDEIRAAFANLDVLIGKAGDGR